MGRHDFPFDRSGDHADLAAWLLDEPDRFKKGRRPSTATSDLALVHVTVHGRQWKAIAPSRVSVALLRTAYVASHDGSDNEHGWRGMGGVAELQAGWAANLGADAAALQAWRAVVPHGPLPVLAGPGPNFNYADQTEPIRILPAALDPLHPQVVTFTVDLSGSTVWDKGYLLLAVVLAADDAIPPVIANETNILNLVRKDRHFAARSVRRAAQLAQTTHAAGMDIKDYPSLHVMNQAFSESNITWTGLYLDSPVPAAGEGAIVQAPPGGPPPPGSFVVPVNATAVLAPFQGHNRGANHPVPGDPYAWMRAWLEIHPDFGVAPLYFGEQIPPTATGSLPVLRSGGPRDHSTCAPSSPPTMATPQLPRRPLPIFSQGPSSTWTGRRAVCRSPMDSPT